MSSIPDDELLDVAARKKLRDPAVLEQQVRRMLADPRSASLVTNFAEQWLFLRDIEAKRPDELLFPDFDETLRAAFHRETDLFLDSVLRGNGSVLDLLIFRGFPNSIHQIPAGWLVHLAPQIGLELETHW